MAGFGAGSGAQVAATEVARIEALDPIVGEIASARSAQRVRFRTMFVATWLVLVGILLGTLILAGKIDGAFIVTWGPYILGGVPITLFVSVTSIFFAVILATLGALGRLSRKAMVYALASFYVSLVRGTPLIVQLLFLYLALPQIWDGFAKVPLIVLGIFGLAFNYGAYMTEIFRAGIQAVPRGQIEASAALGMTEGMTMRRVILPQAVRIITPAIGNEFIAMIKDSALVSVIGVQEILWRAQRIGQSNFRTLETLLIAATVYWIMTIVLSLFQDRLEKRLAESEVRL